MTSPSLPADHAARLARARLALDGLSVGDGFGERFFGPPARVVPAIAARAIPPAPWRTTDDTEMALAIVEVLAELGRVDPDRLASRFAARYRARPDRGYGGMAHFILASIAEGEPWRAVSPAVFDGMGSMGNGGAMRAAPIGAYFADDLAAVIDHARASAEVTHAHPEGQAGAIAVALAAAWAWTHRGRAADGRELLAEVAARTPAGATRDGIARALELGDAATVDEAVQALGNGVQVLASDTVPFALWCAARHLGSYVDALWTTVSGLGDRDTTCAIVGGIVCLASGRTSIPGAWVAAREPLDLAHSPP